MMQLFTINLPRGHGNPFLWQGNFLFSEAVCKVVFGGQHLSNLLFALKLRLIEPVIMAWVLYSIFL